MEHNVSETRSLSVLQWGGFYPVWPVIKNEFVSQGDFSESAKSVKPVGAIGDNKESRNRNCGYKKRNLGFRRKYS
jgi:hypothetical protein